MKESHIKQKFGGKYETITNDFVIYYENQINEDGVLTFLDPVALAGPISIPIFDVVSTAFVVSET